MSEVCACAFMALTLLDVMLTMDSANELHREFDEAQLLS